MGLKNLLLKLLHRTSKPEALQSDANSDAAAMQQRFKAIESDATFKEKESIETPEGLTEFSPPIELQKDSLQLGIAAGYTGKFIKEVESSLNRIESQMTTKDWFSSKFEDQTPKLIELIKNHDLNESKRFEALESALNRMKSTAEKVPEPIREELLEEIETMKEQIPLSSKMEQLITAVKESRQISYDDLAIKLDVKIPSLRGLLANTMKRTDKIERFKQNNKGWVKYKGD